MTCTLRLRYRKLPSIESDIGFGPFRIIWTRYRSKRRNAAADGQAGSEPNGPNRSSGGMDGLPRDRPISEMILGRSRRSRRWRRIDSGNDLHLSAAALFACHAPERIRNIPGKRQERIYGQETKQNERQSKKRTHRKRSHPQPKANQKNKQSNNRQKNIHTHNQSRKPKTIPTKKKPRASCTRLRG